MLFMVVIVELGTLAGQNTARIEEFFNREELKRGQVAVCLLSSSGDVIYERSAHISLIPASTQKLITTLTAAHSLGLDYVYKTDLGYTGEIL